MRRAEDCSGALLGWRRRRGECDRLTTGRWTPRSEQLFRQITADFDERTHHALEDLQFDLARTEIPHQCRDTERVPTGQCQVTSSFSIASK